MDERMKTNQLMKAVVLLAATPFFVPLAQAASQLPKITTFTPSAPTHNLKARPTAWYDPLNKAMGSTAYSGWGKFSVSKGKYVLITAVAKTKGFHPGISVWYRGKSASDIYEANGNYLQNADFKASQANVGTVLLRIVDYGYDQDNNAQKPASLNGKNDIDRVAGKVSVKFIAPYEGTYLFTVGGLSPDASAKLNKTKLYEMRTSIRVVKRK